jgi:DNA-binding response OmpR family regulator
MNESVRILYVDDDPDIRYLMGLVLQKEGFQILFAENGSQALELWGKVPVDLVILDVMMPKLNGFEICRQIRKDSNIPVIFISVLDDEPDVVKGLELGGYDYISKPFRLKELVARIHAVLWRAMPKMPAQEGLSLHQGLRNPV